MCWLQINQAYAFDEEVIPDGAEVALFPPVSGGSDLPTYVQILEGPLDLDELVARITLPTTGAVCMFTGIVRGTTSRGDAHKTSELYYEAYSAMAEAKMMQVADEIRARWPTVEGIFDFAANRTPGTRNPHSINRMFSSPPRYWSI